MGEKGFENKKEKLPFSKLKGFTVWPHLMHVPKLVQKI